MAESAKQFVAANMAAMKARCENDNRNRIKLWMPVLQCGVIVLDLTELLLEAALVKGHPSDQRGEASYACAIFALAFHISQGFTFWDLYRQANAGTQDLQLSILKIAFGLLGLVFDVCELGLDANLVAWTIAAVALVLAVVSILMQLVVLLYCFLTFNSGVNDVHSNQPTKQEQDEGNQQQTRSKNNLTDLGTNETSQLVVGVEQQGARNADYGSV
jgi:hypothetical protein